MADVSLVAPQLRAPHRSEAGAVPAFDLGQTGGVRAGYLVFLIAAVGAGVISSDYWLFILQMSYVMGIVALGTMVVAGYAREVTLMQASLTGSAIYLSGYFYRDNYDGMSLPFPVAVGMATAIVVGISVAVAVISARLQPIYVMVLTLGVQFTIENSLFTYGKLTGGLEAPVVPRPNFYGASLRNEHTMYFFLLATTLVLMILMERFRASRFGRAMISVGNDQTGAAAIGINPWRYRVAAFAMGGLFAGIGGGLWAPQLGAPPGITQFMAMQSLFYLAIPIFAGFDSILAVVLTGMFFMALPMALEQRHFQPMLLGGVALLCGVFLGPRGASGFVHDLSRRLRRSYASDGLGGALRALIPRLPRMPRLLPDLPARNAYRRIRAESTGPSLWDHPLRIASSAAEGPQSEHLETVGGRG